MADGVRTLVGGAGVGEDEGGAGGVTVVGGADVEVFGAEELVVPVTLAVGEVVALLAAVSGAVTPPPQEINKDTPAMTTASL